MGRKTIAWLALLLASCQGGSPDGQSSGGVLSARQAAYDVSAYALDLRIDPEMRRLEGALRIDAVALAPLDSLELDLDGRLEARDAVFLPDSHRVGFRRLGNRLLVAAGPSALKEGDRFSAVIRYGGSPREAPEPPWRGGFTWAETSTGAPWIGVSCQAEGADLWWPVKDHPSDEPDSMRIRITVPRGLWAVSNGRLDSVQRGASEWTYEWFVSTPINPYAVTVAVAPYDTVSRPVRFGDGTPGALVFWALPEWSARAREALGHITHQLAFLERVAGPYPFRFDKLGFAQSPYLGMEHQTLIAYGADFRTNAYGFDDLSLHEMAHEWYGNLVTARDWRDLWLHEGPATYIEALYAEERGGEEAYSAYMDDLRVRILNRRPLVSAASATLADAYFLEGTSRGDPDPYVKGAWILHLLRTLGGKEAVMDLLRRWAYPSAESERGLPARACRLASTEEFQAIAERVLGRPLGWFFDVYLRQASIPSLRVTRSEGELVVEWERLGDLPFEMPVEVLVDGELRRLEMSGGKDSTAVRPSSEVAVDPGGRLLARVEKV